MTKVFWVIAGVVFVLSIWNGHNVRQGNLRLDAKCETHHGTYYRTWDGGRLVAVRCNDNRRFTR